MKRSCGTAVAALALIWGGAAAAETYVLQIEGFGCELCARSLQHRLGQLESVEEVRASFEDSEATVRTHEGVALTEEEAREVVEGAGFELTDYQELPEK